jgi:hypothetical protein
VGLILYLLIWLRFFQGYPQKLYPEDNQGKKAGWVANGSSSLKKPGAGQDRGDQKLSQVSWKLGTHTE